MANDPTNTTAWKNIGRLKKIDNTLPMPLPLLVLIFLSAPVWIEVLKGDFLIAALGL